MCEGEGIKEINTMCILIYIKILHVIPLYKRYLLCVGQHITESSLQSSLTNQDVEVERPATVINIVQGPDAEYPVRTTVMHLRDEARTEQLDCKYLLGCDGAHSDIRQQLGIQTEGETTETHAGVIDALVRTNFNAGRKDVW